MGEHYQKLSHIYLTRQVASEEDALIVAESLIMANLRGVDSHGVVRTDIYLNRLEAEMISVKEIMEISSDGPVALLDGKNRLGQ